MHVCVCVHVRMEGQNPNKIQHQLSETCGYSVMGVKNVHLCVRA